MVCGCGYQIININGSGGVVCGGTSTVTQSPNRYSNTGSGGVVCGGTSTIVTNQPFDGYSGIFHLVENADGTSGEYLDSARRQNGTGGNAPYTPTKTTSNLFGFCQSFDGNDYVQVPIDNHPDNYSVSFWFKITGRFISRVFFSRGQKDIDNGYGVSLAIGHANYGASFDEPEAEPESNRLFARVSVQGLTNWKTYKLQSSTDIPNDCWHHVALVFDSGNDAKLYIDGELDVTKTITETDLVPASNMIQFGKCNNSEFTFGELQEVRFTPNLLTPQWIETEFLNMCSNTLYAEGEEESPVYS